MAWSNRETGKTSGGYREIEVHGLELGRIPSRALSYGAVDVLPV